MAIFDTIINQTIKGFAEDQYKELHSQLAQSRADNRDLKALISLLGEQLMKRTEVIQLVKDSLAEAKTQFDAALTKEKQEIIDKIDEAVKDPDNTLTAEDGAEIKNLILGFGTQGAADIDKLVDKTVVQVPPDNPPGPQA